ncbi:MAG: hypothetical protein OEY58_22855 [Gammaproteobacteria bacterium]|nr:hypothetical protein [Gammaproteobacteria bacterium]
MIGKNLWVVLFVLVLVTTIGCSSTINTKQTWDSDSAIFVDAKQRGIYRTKIEEIDGKEKVVNRYCAEPSPDALSAIAATLGVDFSITDKGKIGLSQSVAESASTIGIRTAAMQALRDIMYRNCEAYASGGITKFGLETLQRRFQSTMVGILAIEQLTGAVRAPATTLVSKANSGSADAIVDLTNKSEVARAALNSAKEAEAQNQEKFKKSVSQKEETEKMVKDGKSEAERIENTDKPSDAEKEKLKNYKKLVEQHNKNVAEEESAKKAYETSVATTKEKQQAYNAIDSARSAALTGGGSGSTAATIETIQGKPLSDEATKHVALAVQNIVGQVTNLSFKDEVCTTLIGLSANTVPKKGSALDICLTLLRDGRIKK